MNKKPTIDDVAREAGVARATVSRVLNSSPNTSERVREKVLKAVAKLGYQVNHQARQLASGSTRVLAIVFAADAEVEPNSYYHSAIELGAMRAATELGFGLVAHTLDPSVDDHSSKIVALASQSRCDGIVLTPPFSDDGKLIGALREAGVALVLISAGPQTSSLAPSVGIDDKEAGRELGAYLYRQGHRRFGFIGGPSEHRSAALRLEGLREALNGKSHSDASIAVVEGNFTFRSGTELAAQLFDARDRPTVLVCANDDMAAGALFTAHRLGLNVPEDISITGFDDTPVSQIVWPPLTTIHQPLRQMGAKAVKLLVSAFAGENGSDEYRPTEKFVPFEMILRQSTATGSTDGR
ncbi:LacI family DNA-binding transcriptional regulator [Sphingopyxis sp. 550A]